MGTRTSSSAVDRERSRIFLEKADLALPDATLATLRTTSDEALGIDGNLLRDAMGAFGIAADAQCARAEAQGTFHRLYDVQEEGQPARLLRIAALAGEAHARLMALECRVVSKLIEAGFPIPTCEYHAIGQAGGPRGVQLVERAPGRSLTTLDEDEPRMLRALRWVGRFLAILHRVRGSGFGPLSLDGPEAGFEGIHPRWADYLFVRLDDHVRACEAFGAVTAAEAKRIAAQFEAMRPVLATSPSCFLHGDPGSHNFLVDDMGIRAVIDWEDALLGDPLFDLASLCTFHPERRHAAIRSAYGADLEPGGEDHARFWLYFLRIALAKTVHRHRFAYEDRPGRAPASQRIQLALRHLDEARVA